MADQQLEQCWVEDLIEGVVSDLGEVCLQTKEEPFATPTELLEQLV